MDIFREFTDFSSPTTNPGIVFWVGELDKELKILSEQALYTVIPLQSIKKLINNPKAKVFGFNNKQGLIGSFSAIGTTLLDSDYTFELLTYRNPSIKNSKRRENAKRIWEVILKSKSFLDTFSNADIRNKVLKIIPHGPDPVFCGIRGKTPEGIISFWKEIQPQPIPELSVIFRTNQGTDVHLATAWKNRIHILERDFSPFETISLEGTVNSQPTWDIGGHLFFDIKFEQKIYPCFAYEPTKKFRKKVNELIKGDKIIVGGSIRPPTDNYSLCINLEKIEICVLSENTKKLNPYCPTCKKRVKSMGKHQGYRCNKCRKKYTIPPLSFDKKTYERDLHHRQILLPDVLAQRHLTKPFERYGNENTNFEFNHSDFIKEMTYINIENI